MTENQSAIEGLARAVMDGERAATAQAITLVESTTPGNRAQAADLLQHLLPATGKAVRLGITGAPGVGKSTMIDQLGLNLIGQDKGVAVLTIDPSSTVSGGSILADKTRMGRLAASEHAFIRPSPSAGTLGGSARRTRESMLVCEAAGFDVVIVETVGIGQSEAVVADIVDFVAVLVQPGGGDELQGLKKGVLEVADMIAVTKADGENTAAAMRTAGDYRAALNIVMSSNAEWRPPVVQISALSNDGLGEFWETVVRHRAMLQTSGALATKRHEQDVRRFRQLIEEELLARYLENIENAAQLTALEDRVRSGDLTPGLALDLALPKNSQPS
ncbi:MAG: methylmalonyl Co-A mutase-associated GTPase MeaB [Rhizobiales bacterium]|nr:methylmalonyl Co-A mutase-associated GTPase MeaB [Hyphomicrobiales bacterium]